MFGYCQEGLGPECETYGDRRERSRNTNWPDWQIGQSYCIHLIIDQTAMTDKRLGVIKANFPAGLL